MQSAVRGFGSHLEIHVLSSTVATHVHIRAIVPVGCPQAPVTTCYTFPGRGMNERSYDCVRGLQPDDTAKVETLRHAVDGKTHPAVEAFHNDR